MSPTMTPLATALASPSLSRTFTPFLAPSISPTIDIVKPVVTSSRSKSLSATSNPLYLTPGQIAGIVIGILGILALALVLLVWHRVSVGRELTRQKQWGISRASRSEESFYVEPYMYISNPVTYTYPTPKPKPWSDSFNVLLSPHTPQQTHYNEYTDFSSADESQRWSSTSVSSSGYNPYDYTLSTISSSGSGESTKALAYR